jgi:hypothetical protein
MTKHKSFWDKVDVRSADECWSWKAGTTKDGYGAITYNGISQTAHDLLATLETDNG